MARISVVDYGLGNLLSVKKGFERVGGVVDIVENPSSIDGDGVVVPGVGAFEDGISSLIDMDSVLGELIDEGVPVLGICLGMQMFFTRSFEGDGWVDGLDIFSGDVVRFSGDLKVPHMGWSEVQPTKNHYIFSGIEDGSYFYFAHSFYVEADRRDNVLAETDYGSRFPSAVCIDNVIGLQFHPEKSGEKGLRVLRNFLDICER
ncbi:imidazole glycerol phosphate synthase subunit HisH [Methanonatronarchaeum sp. AMET6-2]|uniref:imidazole glycerol phosphate synthase subunit HisH n=1 Tax=Methanonatronarchaeum sp. AMET6-2 TaxID=2933293 RepID=UPI0012274C66|nr:imidazole glycerol phosphate synthase subunit HisH [Methanonatronarchaeum sp. AMET6-2]RZN63450.1 MAG: imidazole glycerol phosphate synthase subunit HisH [Methanonatronarchaeia archaeon]UOY09771.1 imidazole glycerol phosphate synthase subunit HisH [Methanonatronarchaeum sp. AMET6-2]